MAKEEIKGDKVKVSKANLNKVLGRKLLERVLHTWEEEYYDEDKEETITFERNEVIIGRGDTLKKEHIDSIIKAEVSTILLVKGQKKAKRVPETPPKEGKLVPKAKSKRRTRPQNIEIATKICDKYKEGFHTIESICNAYDVTYAAFHCWITPDRKGFIQEVQALYKEACDSSDENFGLLIKNAAREELLNRLKPRVATDVKIEDVKNTQGEVTGEKTTTTHKTVMPDATSVIFALTNKDALNFKNQHSLVGEISVIERDKYEGMSLDELDKSIKQMEKQLEKSLKPTLKKVG